MQGAPAYMNMPTSLGVGGLEVTTTIQPQTPRLGIRTGKRFRFFIEKYSFWLDRRALPFYGQPRSEGLPTPFPAGYNVFSTIHTVFNTIVNLHAYGFLTRGEVKSLTPDATGVVPRTRARRSRAGRHIRMKRPQTHTDLSILMYFSCIFMNFHVFSCIFEHSSCIGTNVEE